MLIKFCFQELIEERTCFFIAQTILQHEHIVLVAHIILPVVRTKHNLLHFDELICFYSPFSLETTLEDASGK